MTSELSVEDKSVLKQFLTNILESDFVFNKTINQYVPGDKFNLSFTKTEFEIIRGIRDKLN